MLRGHYIRARGEAEKVRRAIRQQQMTGVRGGSGQGTLVANAQKQRVQRALLEETVPRER